MELPVAGQSKHAHAPGPAPEMSLPGVGDVIAVGAGKGGVGKSTIAVLLAVGLQRRGAKVGLLDADVYGPSIPTLMGVQGQRPEIGQERMMPITSAGVKLISIGSIVDPDQPIVWRGPMVHGVVTQFIGQVEWGELDFLIVDLPPGTGDVPLSLAQSIPLSGSVVVCTPQDVALADAVRALKMYEALNVPALGIVENMSYYMCSKCGHRDEIFDHGGAARAAKKLGVPFLGEIPLNGSVRLFGDDGTPEKQFTKTDTRVREAIETVVASVSEQVAARHGDASRQPTVSIE
ncbi:MAG: Mrp/NBP35 family ATP-binding protein [bacterium]|nr:Mrp/NBP35 family ATP-binding protein [bacterium]